MTPTERLALITTPLKIGSYIGYSPLHLAAYNNNPDSDTFRVLFSHLPANKKIAAITAPTTKTKYSDGFTPFYILVREGNEDNITFVLSHFSDDEKKFLMAGATKIIDSEHFNAL